MKVFSDAVRGQNVLMCFGFLYVDSMTELQEEKKKKKAPSNKCNVGAAPREIKVRYKQKVENSRNAVEWARGQKVYIAQIDGTTHV